MNTRMPDLAVADFAFLDGNFEVRGQRLRNPFDSLSEWVDMPATSTAVLLFDGAVSIDQMWFEREEYFGMSLRLFDPRSHTWTVRWLDGRGSGLQPPVEGRWEGGRCWLTGPVEYQGQPVMCSHAWSGVSTSTAEWEQSFSVDAGETWDTNWTMTFSRTDRLIPARESRRVTSDFDFLQGRWDVRHRRAVDPVAHALGDNEDAIEFDGSHMGRSFFAGAVSIDEAWLTRPDRRGLTFRVYDPATGEWTIYWVNSDQGRLEPPVRGRFRDGIGLFEGVETLGRHEVGVRFHWTDITDKTATWRQEFSVDGGDWDENWTMAFTRPLGSHDWKPMLSYDEA